MAEGRSGRSCGATHDHALAQLNRQIVRCGRCPELRRYCEDVARTKRRAFAAMTYWGKPVPGFGDPAARILIIGLAPAAHGANRTGRMFTGDRSGDFLYAGLYRAGLANQPHATDRNDGLTLRDVYIGAPLRCAPPGNRPTPTQLAACADYLRSEMAILRPRVVLCLGAIGWNSALMAFASSLGLVVPSPKPKFSHGGTFTFGEATFLGCYHVSQQNTFTGRLTPGMFDEVLMRAKSMAG